MPSLWRGTYHLLVDKAKAEAFFSLEILVIPASPYNCAQLNFNTKYSSNKS